MATTLEQKLNLILNEKQTKILPENLKKGVNYFDIEGTLENSGIDTSDATATANDIINPKTAYVDGEKITGTMPNNGSLVYNPSTSQQTIPAGYTSGGTIGAVTSSIDSNIQAENIKAGVTILGVTGTYTGENNESNK